MFRYGKTTRSAIAAMSRLAQIYGGGAGQASSEEIARSRKLPKPLVAKLLTLLSQGGLVTGLPGPGGGYRLARPPHKITLLDVARLFEREDDELCCPFGPTWCGRGKPCPVHNRLRELRQRMIDYLRETDFGVFVPAEAATKRGKPPATRGRTKGKGR